MLDLLITFIDEFKHLIITVLPYFIIGVTAGALIQSYVSTDALMTYLKKGLGPIINASLLGALIPGCACATMPMAEGLKSRSQSLGTVCAFIMASPLLAPHTIILTYGLLGIKFTIGRIAFALVGSITFGFLCHWLQCYKVAGFQFKNNPIDDTCCQASNPKNDSFFLSFWTITKELGAYFLLGITIASLLSTFIPEEAIPRYIGSSGFLAFFLALIIGIPLYVCEGEEIPITLSLVTLGLGQGPAMTFLLGSVGTCLPTFIMAQKTIGKKAMLLYATYWFPFALFSGLVFHYL